MAPNSFFLIFQGKLLPSKEGKDPTNLYYRHINQDILGKWWQFPHLKKRQYNLDSKTKIHVYSQQNEMTRYFHKPQYTSRRGKVTRSKTPLCY